MGIFLIGIFDTHVKGKAVFWAAIISEVLVIILFSMDKIGFLWLNLIGALATVFLSLFLQNILFSESEK